jgi:hypothetical protein
MNSRLQLQDILTMSKSVLERYLDQCRVVNRLVENEDVHVPPTKEEVHSLLAHLGLHGLKPAIAGSVGILQHLGDIDVNGFRPTVDVDVWVSKDPGEPMEGWHQDPEAPGVPSWISPSGGYVDFLIGGHEFPSGEKAPSHVDVDTSFELPVVSLKHLLAMKLNSMREKDLADCIALVRKIGRVPSKLELGKMNNTQKENLDLVAHWFKLRPHGQWGQ